MHTVDWLSGTPVLVHCNISSQFCRHISLRTPSCLRNRVIAVASTSSNSTEVKKPKQRSAVSKPADGPQKRRKGPEPERLSKVLARAGVTSRRKAEDLIAKGIVTVNGEVVTIPQTLVVPGKDKLSVNGKQIRTYAPELYYFAVNKPKGYLCASHSGPQDEGQGGQQRLVVDLLDDWIREWKESRPQGVMPPRLFTVGRLDVQSMGLIFLTNDGQWAQQVAHPSSGVTKAYLVALDKVPTQRQLDTIASGCDVDGAFVRPDSVIEEAKDPQGRPRISVVVNEGRNREVRMLVAGAGLEVMALKRVRVGGYRLPRDLGIGKYRLLRPHEVNLVTDKGAQNNMP